MSRTVYLYVLDTMADWEIGYLTAELNSGRYFKKGLTPLKVVAMGADKSPITTMGGLKIIPDIKVEDCSIKSSDVLILPGADTWMDKRHEAVMNLAERCIGENIAVAAICGATMALAQKGLLDSKWHTSGDLEYLKAVCANYRGEMYYKYAPVVIDGKLITASGVAPLEFTRCVLEAMDVFSSETLDAWYKLFATHEPEHYFALMSSIQ